MKLKITALRRYALNDVRESIFKGSYLTFVRVANEEGQDGIAYNAMIQGCMIGLLPAMTTVRDDWIGDKKENETLAKALEYIWLKKPEIIKCRIVQIDLNASPQLIEVGVIPKKKGM